VEGLKELFGKKIDLLDTNVRALEEGMKFVKRHVPSVSDFPLCGKI